jgi:PKD repeat protein
MVHGVGCFFGNQSLSQVVQRAVIDDLRLRTLRYPMFLQWEQAGGEFAIRDNEDTGQFDWAHYHRIFAKDREISTLQNRPNWFAGLRLLADNSEFILVSAATFWEMNQEIPHLLNVPEELRNAQVAEDYAAVFLQARDAYGIDLHKIFFSINEPDSAGHNAKILSADEHHRLLIAIAHKFSQEGLEAIRFVPPDVGYGWRVRKYLSPLLADSFLRPRIAAGSYHLYGKRGPGDAVAWTNRQDLEAWMTEYWLESDKVDLNIFAQLKSGASWYLSFASGAAIRPDGTRSFGYYTLKHFNRFIEFPSHYLASTVNIAQLHVAAFQHPSSERIGIVIGNTGEATTVEVSLRNIGGLTEMYGYQTGGGRWASPLGPLPVTQEKVVFHAPAGSLTTLVSTPVDGNDAPVAIITQSDKRIVTVGAPVKFRGEQSFDNNGDPLSYRWSFGDGHVSTETNPTHAFSQVGSSRVVLTAVDNKGAESADSILLRVEESLPSAPPSLVIVSPDADQAADAQTIIRWTDKDPDSDARINWFYDTDNKNFDGTRICSLFSDDFESATLRHWHPWRTPWSLVADPERPGNHVVKPEGVNSYLVLNATFAEDIIVSVRQRGLGGPSVRYSNNLEAPASYRLRGNLLLSKRPGNVTLLQENYDHDETRWYWREIEAQDRRYGTAMGVYLRGEVLDENHSLIRRVMYHDLGSFGFVPATRDRGATGVALYAYGRPGQYFDDVCVDAVSARSEDDETDSLVWNTKNVPAGAYYIYAVISDGTQTIRQYSPGRVLIRHERSTITGESSL